MRKRADAANIITASRQPHAESKLLAIPNPIALMGWREICDQPMTNSLSPSPTLTLDIAKFICYIKGNIVNLAAITVHKNQSILLYSLL